jgi:diacylglycerol kinase family enzyme
MAGIGIVTNPHSRRNKSRPALAKRLAEALGGDGEVVSTATLAELRSTAERFKAADIDVLGVNGGDGTNAVTLSAFAEVYGDTPLPRIALLRGGTNNFVAGAIGVHGGPERIVRKIVVGRRMGTLVTTERDLLGVRCDGGPLRCGFIFGAGLAANFMQAYYDTGRATAANAALTFARAVGSAVVQGPFIQSITRPADAEVRLDGESWAPRSWLGIFAGTVHQIGFGFTPFPRCREQPGFFHAVGITANVRRVALQLPAIWLGRPWNKPVALDAVARRVELLPQGPVRCMLDGDLETARQRVELTTGPSLSIILP